MRFDELEISPELKTLLHDQGYITLHPPQAEAIPLVLRGESVVVSIPTASGKSLIGYLAALRMVLEQHQKVLYIVPLKALAAEKKEDLNAFSSLGVKISLSMGDLDSDEISLKDADIVVATSEKADSLIRHGNQFMNDVGLVIADEVHLIHDPGRGPTLEVALTKMMRRNPSMQIIALSATISNANDLADWMKARLVSSTWRPVPLREGVYLDGEIFFADGKNQEVDTQPEPLWGLIRGAIDKGGQCLVFVNSRRSTESVAFKYSKFMKPLSGTELDVKSKNILEGETEPTSIGKKLAHCVSAGIAFHHAGLSYQQRKLVENSFKDGYVKCIVATPTLAAGINLPARRVIVRDTSRYDANAGTVSISVMELRQMCGRAGRPRYDRYGEAVLMAKSEDDKYHLMDNYIDGEAEEILSKLGSEPVLRGHILGLLATGDAHSREDIMRFIQETFYGHQSALYGLEEAVNNIVKLLIEHGMAEEQESLQATWFGKRVSDLYIDPKSALLLRQALENWNPEVLDLAILQVVCSTPDVMSLYLRKKDQDWVFDLMDEMEGLFLIAPPEEENECQFFVSDFKVAYLLQGWIEEQEEEELLNFFSVGPGDLRNRTDSAEWLLYSMLELAKQFCPEARERLTLLLLRIRHGVKNELTDLIRLRGIGRSRARLLFNAGYINRKILAEADEETLSKLPHIGRILANSILSQVGGKMNLIVDESEEKIVFQSKVEDDPTRQSSLFDF